MTLAGTFLNSRGFVFAIGCPAWKYPNESCFAVRSSAGTEKTSRTADIESGITGSRSSDKIRTASNVTSCRVKNARFFFFFCHTREGGRERSKVHNAIQILR